MLFSSVFKTNVAESMIIYGVNHLKNASIIRGFYRFSKSNLGRAGYGGVRYDCVR